MEVKNRIRVIRDIRGMTQSELAKKVGVTQGYISQLEKQEVFPAIDVTAKIAAVLETKMCELYYVPGTNECKYKRFWNEEE